MSSSDDLFSYRISILTGVVHQHKTELKHRKPIQVERYVACGHRLEITPIALFIFDFDYSMGFYREKLIDRSLAFVDLLGFLTLFIQFHSREDSESITESARENYARHTARH